METWNNYKANFNLVSTLLKRVATQVAMCWWKECEIESRDPSNFKIKKCFKTKPDGP